MKLIRSIFCLLALSLLFGSVSAHALLVSVEVLWGYEGAGLDAEQLKQTYHLEEGSIIQFVAFDSHGGGAAMPSPTDPSQNFVSYGSAYQPDTVVPNGHHIVGTGKVQDLSDEIRPGVFGLTTWIDVPYPYDSLYVRVFSATEFPEGEPVDSWWGISSASNLTDSGFGTTLTWFDNTELLTNHTFEVIPEPASLSFLLSGGCGMGLFALCRRRRSLRPPEE